MSSNGSDPQSQKPPTEDLKRWARVPQPSQSLVTESEFTPEKARQPRPLSGHPVIKIALVSGLTLPIFALAGTMMNANRPTPQAATSPNVPPSPNATDETSDAKTIAAQREALGQTQANYALKEQQDRLKQQPPLSQETPKGLPTVKTPAKPETRKVAPVEPVASPQPISYTPSAPVVQRIQSPPRISAPVPITPSASASRESEQDTYDRYIALTQMGSYGQIAAEKEAVSASDSAAEPEISVEPTTIETSSNLAPSGVDTQEEAAILQEQPQKSILASTKTEGILATPIILDEKTKSGEKAQQGQFTIQITAPLKAQDNSIALPEGTQLIAEVDSMSDSGLVKLNVESAIVIQDGQSLEIKIPPEAIQITGHRGQPLIAKSYGDKVIAAMNRKMALLGALSKASEQFTRPSSSSIISNNSSVISSVQNSNPNLLAGILQGGSEALLNSMTQRNQRALQEASQQSNIRFLPAGSSVDIYINQSVSIPVVLTTALTQPSNLIRDIDHPDKNDLSEIKQDTEIQSLKSRITPETTSPAIPPLDRTIEPKSVSTPEWSKSYETETSSERQFNRTQLNRPNCNTSSLTCENDHHRASTRTIKPVTHPSRTLLVWIGSGTNLSFIPTGETIQRVWLDDPSRITLDFDAPLCQGGDGRSCGKASTSVIHLRRIRPLNWAGLPQASSTLLTVITEGSAGRQIYQFRVAYGSGTPQYSTLEVRGNSGGSVRLSHVERGLQVAIAKGLVNSNARMIAKVNQFLTLSRTGMEVSAAAQKSGVSLKLVNKLAELGTR